MGISKNYFFETPIWFFGFLMRAKLIKWNKMEQKTSFLERNGIFKYNVYSRKFAYGKLHDNYKSKIFS